MNCWFLTTRDIHKLRWHFPERFSQQVKNITNKQGMSHMVHDRSAKRQQPKHGSIMPPYAFSLVALHVEC
jgi:hypothetical protein